MGNHERIDIHLVDGLLHLDSEIAGIPGYSFIDTGAQVKAINGRFLEFEGLSYKKGRSVKVRGAFADANRGKSKGLLGYDILQPFVVTIDYKSGHMHFYPGEKLSEEPAAED